MYKPIRIDPDNVPVYSSRDVDDYGFPEHYGIEIYRIIECRDPILVHDYYQRQQSNLRNIHRYSRLERFRKTLLSIIGERGRVPDYVIAMVRNFLNISGGDHWNRCRAVLKHFGQRKYYDEIPFILNKLGHGRLFDVTTGDQIESIIRHYKILSDKFERRKSDYQRRYFPNIRFIVFKLLQLHNINPNYSVPFIRTTRKNKSLESLWAELMK